MVTGSPVGCGIEGGGNRPKQSEPLPNSCNRFTYLFVPAFLTSLSPPRNSPRVTKRVSDAQIDTLLRRRSHISSFAKEYFQLLFNLNLLTSIMKVLQIIIGVIVILFVT